MLCFFPTGILSFLDCGFTVFKFGKFLVLYLHIPFLPLLLCLGFQLHIYQIVYCPTVHSNTNLFFLSFFPAFFPSASVGILFFLCCHIYWCFILHCFNYCYAHPINFSFQILYFSGGEIPFGFYTSVFHFSSH